MYKLTLGVLEQEYLDLDPAMIDCFEIYPDADFSDWHDESGHVQMDIFENNKSSLVVGTIKELP